MEIDLTMDRRTCNEYNFPENQLEIVLVLGGRDHGYHHLRIDLLQCS